MVSQDGLYEFYSTILELYLEADARDRVTAALFLFQDVEEEEERFGKEALEAMVSFFFIKKSSRCPSPSLCSLERRLLVVEIRMEVWIGKRKEERNNLLLARSQ